MQTSLSRREAIAVTAAGLALAGHSPAWAQAATANDHAELIKKFTGGKIATAAKVSLDLPDIAENGNTVPVTIKVDSPMAADDYVESVLVVADGNPRGGVATLRFSPSSGVAEVNTRIRLAQTQTVTAIAKTSKGEFFTASRQVKVTIGGCGG